MTGPGGGFTPPAIFDMLLAYKTTALLRTGIEVGVFDVLAAAPAGADEVAATLQVDRRGARLLLDALAALRLLERDDAGETGDGAGPTYRTAPGVDMHLVRGRPGYVGDMARVMASDAEWEAMRRLAEAVRKGGTVMPEHAETPGYTYWEDFAAYAGAVAGPTAERVAAVLADWAAGRDRLHVLDMACGHGLYGYTLARHQPHARVWSLDWPNVLPLTLANAERLGVADRVSTISGDMFEVPLGGPYDAVMVTNVLHHFPEERGVELLRRAAGAVVPGGKVVLVGLVVGDGPPALDPAPHLFSILMLVWTFDGEVHSVAAYERMLAEAGLANATMHEMPSLPLRIIVADRL